MKRVEIPVADKEGESTKSSSSTPPKQTPLQHEDDNDTYSGQRRILPEEVMGLIAPSLKIGTVGGMFTSPWPSPTSVTDVLSSPFSTRGIRNVCWSHSWHHPNVYPRDILTFYRISMVCPKLNLLWYGMSLPSVELNMNLTCSSQARVNFRYNI